MSLFNLAALRRLLTGMPAPAPAPQIPKSPALVLSGVSPEVVEFSAAFEGFRAEPYADLGNGKGTWTIGYGSTRDKSGNPVTPKTPRITEAEAHALTARDLAHAAKHMERDFPAGLPPRWWAAGVLMCNNLGRMSVWGKTLRALLLAGDWQAAAAQMRHYRNSDGFPVTGLRRRRWAEAAYALGMDPKEARQRAWSEIHTVDDWPMLPTSKIK